MHWGRSKPFRRSHIYIAISPELWEPGNPVFGLFWNKEGLVEVLWHNQNRSQGSSPCCTVCLPVFSYIWCEIAAVFSKKAEGNNFTRLITVFVFPGKRRLTQRLILLYSQEVSVDKVISIACVKKKRRLITGSCVHMYEIIVHFFEVHKKNQLFD